LRNLVNWQNITDAQQKPAPCKRFVELILDADNIAAALVFFGMADINDTPSNEMLTTGDTPADSQDVTVPSNTMVSTE